MESLNKVLTRILSVNYRTTLLGIGAILAAGSRISIAYRTRDIAAIAVDGQLIAETLATVLAGLGLLIAKDSAVTGVGTQAKAVDSSGVVTNVQGDVVGRQSAIPPQIVLK